PPRGIDKRMLFAVVEQGAPGSDPPANALAPAWLDREAMMERLGGDADLFADVVDFFLEDCPPHVAAIEAAVDACDADRSERRPNRGPVPPAMYMSARRTMAAQPAAASGAVGA
ncbi:MAG: hypothetical protein DMF92_21010, partial [Acidobacteria bacterium]